MLNVINTISSNYFYVRNEMRVRNDGAAHAREANKASQIIAYIFSLSWTNI